MIAFVATLTLTAVLSGVAGYCLGREERGRLCEACAQAAEIAEHRVT